MFERDFRRPINWRDYNVRLFDREKPHAVTQTEDGLVFTTKTRDGYVPGDKRWYDRLLGTSYKDRSEIGRVGLAEGEGEHGRLNRYEFRCKLLDRPNANWLILVQSHCGREVDETYPYGWTFNISANKDKPHRLQFLYGIWGRPEPQPQHTDFAAGWGEWWDIRVDVKWSTGEDGYAKVFLNGDKVAGHHGPNMPTQDAMQMKWGIYRGNRVRGSDSVLFEGVRFSVL